MLYAPFVKAVDKVRRDPSEMSFSDFHPKRFAINYDPPVIVLEYMVPSTGKLYHHKMRLRNLTKDSNVNEIMKYLEQRHPLYFLSPKLKKEQIRKLIEKIQFKMKAAPKVPLKQKSDLNNLQKPQMFKTGSSLPTVDEGKENNREKFKHGIDDYDEEEEGSAFDANELLDLTDYRNKRGNQLPSAADIAAIKPKRPDSSAAKAPVKQSSAAADEAWELEDDDGWGEDDMADLKKFDYQNTDLNKMTDYQLNRHKQNMDKEFSKKVVRPGDKDFEYDKRVDYSSQIMSAQNGNTSWDEDEDKQASEDDYFDDDFA